MENSSDLDPDIEGSFAMNLVGLPTRICGLLKHDPRHDVWNWKRICNDKFMSHAFVTKEGLYFERCDGVQKVVNLHTNEAIVLPNISKDNAPGTIRCMVSTGSPFHFEVIMGGYAEKTLIYDKSSCNFRPTEEESTYPLGDIQEWMTRGGTIIYNKGVVFILYHWRSDIVAYFIDRDQWGCVTPPFYHYEHDYELGFEPLLCGIGCWEDHIYCSSIELDAVYIWKLTQNLTEDWKWENVCSLRGGDYQWLLHDNVGKNSYIQVQVFSSFRDNQVLLYSYSQDLYQRLILGDLKEERSWKKIILRLDFEAKQVNNIRAGS